MDPKHVWVIIKMNLLMMDKRWTKINQKQHKNAIGPEIDIEITLMDLN